MFTKINSASQRGICKYQQKIDKCFLNFFVGKLMFITIGKTCMDIVHGYSYYGHTQ